MDEAEDIPNTLLFAMAFLYDIRKSSLVYFPSGILYPVPALNIPDADISFPDPENPGPASRYTSHLLFIGSFPK